MSAYRCASIQSRSTGQGESQVRKNVPNAFLGKALAPTIGGLLSILCVSATGESRADTPAYNCVLELRAIDDEADEAIRKVGAEIARLRTEVPYSSESVTALAAAEDLRVDILERQHRSLNEVRRRCDLRRELLRP